MTLYSFLLRNTLLPLGDRVFGQRMIQRLKFLEEAQWWDRERLYARRDASLRDLVSTSYAEVPLYRELMDAARVKPADIRTPADLMKLPIVDKALLRANHPHRTTRTTGQKTYDEFSSGSTGRPFSVKEDAYTAGWYRASFMLGLEWTGWQIGTPYLQTGMALKRSLAKRLKDNFLRCRYVTAYNLQDERLDANLSILEKYKLEHLMGYPGSIYYLALRAQRVGWNHPLKSVVTWGDTLYPHYRKTIEEAFQTRVYDHYGCAEGIWVSAQCGEGQTYHIHTLDVVVEYLDDDDQPVPAGQPGHLILTRLHPGPMPLLRYRVGDIGISGGARLCECGRSFDVMESIQGRDTDVVITPSGNRLIVHFFTGIIEYFLQVDTFQVIQTEPDRIVVRIVPASGYSPEVEREIVARLKAQGADLNIQVETVPEIPLSSGGKRRFVINQVERS